MCDHSPNREAAMVIIDPGSPERHGRDGIWCDPCLEPLIRALNNAGMATAASCCGHSQYPGWVMLHDGRDIVIYPDHMSNLAVNDPQLHASLLATGGGEPVNPRGENL